MMTLPLNKKQKQLVEKSMDLVPIMIRSMTRTAAYVTEGRTTGIMSDWISGFVPVGCRI